ncbi:MAG: ABC transporter ATP-binding protein/permease [Peptococcaceae bacterium]|jgi:ATP-binding cassette subfamily B protein|nr:ABC transporter ATP-binding protein/permease [Peptococcaceae bacterium]
MGRRGAPGRGPLGRGPGPLMMPGDKARDFRGTMKKLAGYLGRYRWTILFVWLLALASTVFATLGPKILAGAIDALVSGFMLQLAGTGGIDFEKIGRIMLGLVGLYLVSAAFFYWQGFVMTGVTMKVTYRMRDDIQHKIHTLPLRYFDKTTHGEVLSRITNDVDTISHTLNQSLTQIITSLTSIIGILLMMLTISWRMTLAALCIIPLSLICVTLIVKKSQKYFVNQQKYLGHVNGHVEEMFGSHVVMKAFNGEKDSLKTFSGYNDALYQFAWKANFLSGLMMPITALIGNFVYVVICVLGGYFTVNGTMTIGGIQAFIQYVRSLTQPVSQLANISNILQQTVAAAERVFEFLNEAEETPEAADALTVSRKDGPDGAGSVRISGGVCFEHAAFGYDPQKLVIHDFSIRVEPGQKIAIVGPTGAGKTTIVKLLMRFYDVNSGRITVGGYDVQSFKRDELRSIFGMVLQDTWLFNGTIADNIRYGRLDATNEEVIAAARAAQVDHFVRTLPDGYQMVLNEEADNISQGQKQLLTIARAILADPEILILDEATSSVDTRTETLIQKGMDHLMKGRTSFVIAHRLSTIRHADLILCMRDGDIVEQGTHDELLAKNGFYANLYNSQFETAG